MINIENSEVKLLRSYKFISFLVKLIFKFKHNM